MLSKISFGLLLSSSILFGNSFDLRKVILEPYVLNSKGSLSVMGKSLEVKAKNVSSGKTGKREFFQGKEFSIQTMNMDIFLNVDNKQNIKTDVNIKAFMDKYNNASYTEEKIYTNNKLTQTIKCKLVSGAMSIPGTLYEIGFKSDNMIQKCSNGDKRDSVMQLLATKNSNEAVLNIFTVVTHKNGSKENGIVKYKINREGDILDHIMMVDLGNNIIIRLNSI